MSDVKIAPKVPPTTTDNQHLSQGLSSIFRFGHRTFRDIINETIQYFQLNRGPKSKDGLLRSIAGGNLAGSVSLEDPVDVGPPEEEISAPSPSDERHQLQGYAAELSEGQRDDTSSHPP